MENDSLGQTRLPNLALRPQAPSASTTNSPMNPLASSPRVHPDPLQTYPSAVCFTSSIALFHSRSSVASVAFVALHDPGTTLHGNLNPQARAPPYGQGCTSNGVIVIANAGLQRNSAMPMVGRWTRQKMCAILERSEHPLYKRPRANLALTSSPQAGP